MESLLKHWQHHFSQDLEHYDVDKEWWTCGRIRLQRMSPPLSWWIMATERTCTQKLGTRKGMKMMIGKARESGGRQKHTVKNMNKKDWLYKTQPLLRKEWLSKAKFYKAPRQGVPSSN